MPIFSHGPVSPDYVCSPSRRVTPAPHRLPARMLPPCGFTAAHLPGHLRRGLRAGSGLWCCQQYSINSRFCLSCFINKSCSGLVFWYLFIQQILLKPLCAVLITRVQLGSPPHPGQSSLARVPCPGLLHPHSTSPQDTDSACLFPWKLSPPHPGR